MSARVSDLHYVALAVPDLAAEREFFSDTWGLVEVGESDGKVYFAAEGTGVLLISSELPELVALSTRILVLRDGRLVGALERDQANQESLLRMMAGLAPDGPRLRA